MGRIFKYDFGPLSPGTKTITVDNEINYIMDFQEQYGNLVMWASVGDNVKPQNVTIEVKWTGDSAPPLRYVQTIQGSDSLVYHIFI